HLGEVHERQPQLLLDLADHGVLAHQPHADQRGAQQLPGAPLLRDGVGQVLRGDELGFDQEVAEPLVLFGHAFLPGGLAMDRVVHERYRPVLGASSVVLRRGRMLGSVARTESTVPGTASAPSAPKAPPAVVAEAPKPHPALVLHLSEGFDTSTNLSDLLRAAGRHCRKLVDCETARIWLARRAGTRLVAR